MTTVMVIGAAWVLLAVLGLAFMAALGRAAARGDAAVDPEVRPEAVSYLRSRATRGSVRAARSV